MSAIEQNISKSPRTGRTFVYRAKPRKQAFAVRVRKSGSRFFPHAPRLMPFFVSAIFALFLGFLAIAYSEGIEMTLLDFYDEATVGYSQARHQSFVGNLAVGVLTFAAFMYVFYRKFCLKWLRFK